MSGSGLSAFLGVCGLSCVFSVEGVGSQDPVVDRHLSLIGSSADFGRLPAASCWIVIPTSPAEMFPVSPVSQRRHISLEGV